MAPKRSTSAESAARFHVLRGAHPVVLMIAKHRAKQQRLDVARGAIEMLSDDEKREFLMECIARYERLLVTEHDKHDTDAPRVEEGE